ncbi:DNA polymerase III subunit alpha [Evansella halocellulosilytica]|uniref:DNA polymerase III subunit alpha n=1 Tax=Evansella halocellulosilytica TaxID=2011013 RepID=UPI000BB6B65A|nr:DNA polymerase III subunit alpha [Evansella halocellulosilytica]
MSFVHLHVHSEYSLLRSTGKINELIEASAASGFEALAITDTDAMYGVIQFYKCCKENHIKPIIGVELGFTSERLADTEQVSSRIVLLAENLTGYRSLLKLTSLAQQKQVRQGVHITAEELEKHADGVIIIIPFEDGEVAQYLMNGQPDKANAIVDRLQQMTSHEHVFIEIQNHWRKEEREKLLAVTKWCDMTNNPMVASNHVHFTKKEQSDAHRVIQAVRLGEQLSTLPESYSSEHYYLKTKEEMLELFQAWPNAVQQTVEIAKRCNVELTFGIPVLPHYPLQQHSSTEYLRMLCHKGISERYASPSKEIWDRLDYELTVISNMQYEDYFLIVADFMNYAHKQKILTGPGRGSAAGSLVAYALKITNVDPIKYGLLFERFLNPERVSMPDIDIDFPDDQRDEVIHYVKDKYGIDRVAQIVTFGTLAAKAAIRDAGRVLGIDLKIIDRVAKKIPSRPNIRLKEAISESESLREMIQSDHDVKELFRIACDVEGLPRHTSIHAAGVVMSKEPLTNVVPLQQGNDGMNLTQFPMGDLEDLGLLKMDFLGLRNLSFLERIIRLVHQHRGELINIDDIPFNDHKTFELLGRGETSGVFQLESSGMKSVLRRLKPTEFEDIVAVNALYRPGPMENIPVYINRKNRNEPVKYLHPDLETILKPTYGVLIYQEQIMQIASKMAGYSLGEADILRRAVGKKKHEDLIQGREQFVQGSLNKGYSEQEANDMYDTIVRFANYGFNRSHAVAYSIIAYQLAYLKANYPLEFMSALMGTVVHHHEKLAEYISEARKQGMVVKGPSIKHSEPQFTVKDRVIWIGLATIKNVGNPIVHAIAKIRREHQIDSLFDLCYRVPAKLLPKRALEAFIVSGALDDFGVDRAKMLATVDTAIEYGEKEREKDEGKQTALFYEEDKPLAYIDVPPLRDTDKLNFEKQVLGFYASGHPVEAELSIVKPYDRKAIYEAKQLDVHSRVRLAGLIEGSRTIQTKKKQQMAFLNISDETGEVDVTVFPEAYERYRTKLNKGEMIFVEGKIQDHRGEKKVIMEKCITLSDLKRKHEKNKKPVLYLKISHLHEHEGYLDRLKRILQDDPGEVSVVLFYERTEKAIHLSEMWDVSGDDSLLNRLKALLGQKNVILKEQRV